MAPRLFPLLLFLPCCALAQPDNQRWNISGGLSGGSLNFQQNGNVGVTAQFSYNLFQGRRSSLSVNQTLTIGTSDQYGISFPPFAAVLLALSFTGYEGGELDLSDGHRIAAYSDFPLLLHYNFGAGALRGTEQSSREKLGFYIGGGATHTFMAYTNTFDLAAPTDYWAWVADGGIRLKGQNTGQVTAIGIGIEQPLRSPIGPIHNPLFFQLNVIWQGKF